MLTPQFVQDLKTIARIVGAQEYDKLTTAEALWYRRVAREVTSKSAKEVLIWLLDTALIRREDDATFTFEELLSKKRELVNEFASAGFTGPIQDFEDLEEGTAIAGGKGIRQLSEWARQVAQQAVYFPQQEVAKAIRDNIPTYDDLAFFHHEHPLNPFKPSLGTYANLLDGTSLDALGLGTAKPSISAFGAHAVALDVAIANVQRCIAAMAAVKMPNGEQPRKLRPVGLMVPPAMVSRAQQITNARFVGSTGGGTNDNDPIVRNWGFGEPIQADELGAAMGGSDTSWYMIMAGIDRDEVGAFTWQVREPFSMIVHTPETDAQLALTREVQASMAGRNAVGGGHPYLFVRCDGAVGT